MPIGNSARPPMRKASTTPNGPPRESQSSMTTSQPTPTMVPNPSEKKSARRSFRAREIMKGEDTAGSAYVRTPCGLSLQIGQHVLELLRSSGTQQFVDDHLSGGDDCSGSPH